jgi:predicted MFS family arabinose efflux permease
MPFPHIHRQPGRRLPAGAGRFSTPGCSGAARSAQWGRISALAMLFVLASGFAVSQAFRTVASIMGLSLTQEFGLTPQMMGAWSAAFHLTFGLAQLPMGVAIDVYGPRRTVLFTAPWAVVGACICATAHSYTALVIGQGLIGLGCAPAFLACTVFIARQFDNSRFGALSGLCMSFASLGIVYTGTPLAFIVEHGSWRVGYGSLAAIAAASTLLIYLLVSADDSPAPHAAQPSPQRLNFAQAMREMAPLLRMPHTLGLLCFALVSYAAFITLRGLWLGPLLQQRHGLSLIDAGNVALVMTVGNLIGPATFGKLDPGGTQRTTAMVVLALLGAASFAVMALGKWMWFDIGAAISYGFLAGYGVWQYAYAKAAYPANQTGRAIALLNTSMFLGVALMQWLTGVTSTWAGQHGIETFEGALLTVAIMLALGATAFALLPKARQP